MQKKVFIIGASGMIGSALHNVFSRNPYEVIGGDVEPLRNDIAFVDITRPDTLEQTIHRIQPDILFLTAAQSHVDYCEEFPEEAERVNIEGLRNVLKAIDRERTTLVYFSSDYIFDGAEGPYAEDDTPNPLCVYGKHKLMAETMIKKTLKNYLIVRTTGVYGPEHRGKNFVLGLLKRIRGGEQIKVPYDQVGSPTYSENLAEIIGELLQKEKRGTYNIAGPERIDRFSFAQKICRTFGFSEDMLISVATKELEQKAARPLQGGFKLDKIKREIAIPLSDTTQGLLEMKRTLSHLYSTNHD